MEGKRHVLERGVVLLLYAQGGGGIYRSGASHLAYEHGSGQVHIEDFWEGEHTIMASSKPKITVEPTMIEHSTTSIMVVRNSD